MKTVLVVDDDENDLVLVRLAFQRANLPHQLVMARSAEEAIAYLEGTGKYADRAKHPAPNLVFLDIKLAGMDGLHMLSWMRSNPAFKHMPVIMLTGSERGQDIQRAYELGATSYFAKTADFPAFGEMLKTTLTYWFQFNLLPLSA